DVVVVPAGSCATMMRKFWPELFELVGDNDRAGRAANLAERTFEFSEFLDERRSATRLPNAQTTPPESTVAYHHSCHMLRELGIKEAPLELLRDAGLAVTDWADSERCCGFGGMFSFKLPEVSVAMADEKLASFSEGDTTTLVGCDISCLLHLRARAEHEGVPIQIRHLAEVLVERRAES
ncbi:MAG: (Fe-S)-binding protein, partial [Acidimicrobiales bacterium]